MIGGRVLDTSALVDAATGKSIYARALIRTAVDQGIVLAVPATALMVAWATVPPSGRPFLGLLPELPVAVVDKLDEASARDAGLLLANADPAAAARLAAGHVAHSARWRQWPVVTAEPGPVRAVAADVEIENLP